MIVISASPSGSLGSINCSDGDDCKGFFGGDDCEGFFGSDDGDGFFGSDDGEGFFDNGFGLNDFEDCGCFGNDNDTFFFCFGVADSSVDAFIIASRMNFDGDE